MAGNIVFLRGQVGQDLDTAEYVGIGDPAAQAEQAMSNIARLLEESGSRLEEICKIVIYLTDIRYREAVYTVVGKWLKGVHPVSTGLVVEGAGPARVAGGDRRHRRDRVIDADELAAFAAVPAPTGRRGAAAARGSSSGWRARRARGAATRPGTWCGASATGRPELLVMAHVDTVFDADTELRFERDGDDLVGPGVGDNATAVMATVWALERIEPPAGLVVAFTVGEEGLGNLRGARQACARPRAGAGDRRRGPRP